MMSGIKSFVFNPFQVNTYILFDDTGECLIIDPACYDEKENFILQEYIKEKSLKPVAILNTHAHVDHLTGVNFFKNAYSIPFLLHKADLFLLHQAVNQGLMFGFELETPPEPDRFPEEGERVTFGHSSLEVLHVPGHSPGSLVFLNRKEKYLISGDVLFNGSIGRTDLPGGNYELLIEGIKEKLMVLEDSYKVYPGHGPSTTIVQERTNNPFLG